VKHVVWMERDNPPLNGHTQKNKKNDKNKMFFKAHLFLAYHIYLTLTLLVIMYGKFNI
jgi:hypothetical protein